VTRNPETDVSLPRPSCSFAPILRLVFRFAASPPSRLAVVVIGLASICLAQSWVPGRFAELITGTSRTKDVLRVLGPAQPKVGKSLITYSYPGKGDFGGDLTVEISRSTGIVQTITSRPEQNITRTEAYRKFGRDYNEVHYSVAKCGEGTNPPVYRDKNGAVELLEYPRQGVILWPNRYGFDIAAIVYRAKPLPATKPHCR
jgi:hypothetical protein